MKRKEIDVIKAEVAACSSALTRWSASPGGRGTRKAGTLPPASHTPEDTFNGGQYVAAVKRASLDLSKALVEIRR